MGSSDSVGIDSKPPRRFWRFVKWVLLWGTVFGLSGVALVAITNQGVIWTSSDAFCGKFCHSMNWAADAYKKGPHYINQVGVRANCGQCHIPYDSGHATAIEYVELLAFKADRGAKDFWGEATKYIDTKEEWEKRRPALSRQFEGFLKQHNFITCLGCHKLDAFGGPRNEMKVLIHKDVIKSNDVDCLRCHRNIGHVYEVVSPKVEGGWYTTEQAAAGEKLFESDCSACHGAKLEGGAGPALTGSSWLQLYGGAKLLTVWGEIKGPMAQYAGKTYTTKQSLDILAFLLQKNNLPAGKKALEDTSELSDVLPSK